MSGEDGAAVPKEEKGTWLQFLKNISSFSGDLSALTAPSFILSPTSLAEFSAYWGDPAEEFAAISTGKTPEDRIQLVLKWFISTLKGQYLRRETQTGSEKKPLNPILGELFTGSWPDQDGKGDLQLYSEQVSHHPPITAYLLDNRKAGVSLQGHCGQKTAFSGRTIIVRQVGHAMLRVKLDNGEVESYLITLPKLRIEGLWYGSPYVELVETSDIQSSSGYRAKIEYKGKGYFSGKPHSFTAQISPTSSASPIYTIDGQWNGKSSYVKPSRSNEGKPFVDCSKERKEVQVKPVEEQSAYESRRVWKDVAEGIRKGNFDAASAAKTKLENEQRQRRKDEQSAGKPWKLQFFAHVADDGDYRDLAALLSFKPENEESFVFRGDEAVQKALARKERSDEIEA